MQVAILFGDQLARRAGVAPILRPDDKGGSQLWGLEGQAPGELVRHGWTRHSMNVGDKISVQIHPLKDGQLGGSFGIVTFADGTILSSGFSIGTPPPP